MTTVSHRSGGKILVDQLIAQGVQHIFCVPGESYLAVLDALYESPIQVTVCRHEGGAAMMAEAYGKLTGKPGICWVTRAPGATNGAGGIHIARQDSSPMIMLVGQIDSAVSHREAFQELDYSAVFGTMSKWVAQVDDPARLPELIARAFSIAQSGRPGPVVLAFPENILTQKASVADAPLVPIIDTVPSPAMMEQLNQRLHQSQKPLMILGGSRWSEEAVKHIVDFAQRWHIPTAVSFRRQMLFPTDHPCFVGDLGFGINPALAELVKSADLIILVGGRMSEVPSQNYTLLKVPQPQQKLVHVHPEVQELLRVYQADLPIHATPSAFANALANLALPTKGRALAWQAHTLNARQAYCSWSDLGKIHTPGALQMERVMAFINERLPPDSIVCNGAGNFATWVHRFYPFRRFATQLAPTCGFMGYGLPAGLAAKTLYPERMVVVFAGDGDFLMTGQDFATAVQYRLNIIVVLIDNGMYGTIRMHQETHYPARVFASALTNPDFAEMAKAFGGYGECVRRSEDFPSAFERACASQKPAILHCPIDPEAITPSTTLSAIRERSLRAATAQSFAD